MDKLWMQFNDSEMTQPCGWSFWEQPIESWPYQQDVTLADPRYVAYYDSMPPWVQSSAPAPDRS